MNWAWIAMAIPPMAAMMIRGMGVLKVGFLSGATVHGFRVAILPKPEPVNAHPSGLSKGLGVNSPGAQKWQGRSFIFCFYRGGARPMVKAATVDRFISIFRRRLPPDLKIRDDALSSSVNVHRLSVYRKWVFRLRF
jgi:hypothetical protein